MRRPQPLHLCPLNARPTHDSENLISSDGHGKPSVAASLTVCHFKPLSTRRLKVRSYRESKVGTGTDAVLTVMPFSLVTGNPELHACVTSFSSLEAAVCPRAGGITGPEKPLWILNEERKHQILTWAHKVTNYGEGQKSGIPFLWVSFPLSDPCLTLHICNSHSRTV